MRRLFNRSIALAKLLSIAASLAAFSIPTAATAAFVTFDFEEYAIGNYSGGDECSPPCAPDGGVLVDKGFVLDPGRVDWSPDATGWIGHYHIFDGTGPPSAASNGTKYFVFDYFGDASRLHIYRPSRGEFGVRQLDLAESGAFNTPFCDPETDPFLCLVTFVGILAESGEPIVATVLLDRDRDFETFSFGTEWDRLTMFSIIANEIFLNPGLDNLVLRVPEPTSLALLGLSLAGLAFTRRRRQVAIQNTREGRS